VQSVAPNYAKRAKGAVFWDVDGNEFLEYSMSLGPILLGYSYPAVVEAVQEMMQHGTIFSLPHELEIEVSQMIVDEIPSAEMVRFGKNGSDVTSAAVRVARAFTKREKIACCGYHGWQDWHIATTTRNQGVPKSTCELTKTFSYNNIASLEELFGQNPNEIAAVILEPIGIVEPEDGFLEQVKELTHKHGAVLIFDEVVTGFRMAMGGAQEYFNVIPDLTCCGKAMGNGFPVAAIAGRAEIMKKFDDVFFSFTFGGETASLAAAKAVITELREKPVHDHIWALGKRLKEGFNTLSKHYGLVDTVFNQGLPPRASMVFHEQDSQLPIYKSLFQQECLKRGLFFTGAHFISFSHTYEHIDFTLRVYNTVLEILAEAIASGKPETWLEDAPIQPVFRKP
jgi:glutamate-1-semialdehyde 2,1-aminomutase/spore coat polysaccharide biosynthesis protein SpsF